MPKAVRLVLGFQLDRIQRGNDPSNWKSVTGLGKGIPGVREIRVEIETNIYRSAYVTKFGDSIAVLHCWEKKTQRMTEADKKVIVERYKAAQDELT